MSNDIPAQAVSVEEAARRLGLTPDAIRKRIRRGQLETRRVNHARGVHVILPEIPQCRPEDAQPDTVLASELKAAAAALQAILAHQESNTADVLREAVSTLKEQLVIKDQQLAERDRQILDLRAVLLEMSNNRPKGLVPRLRVLLWGAL